MPDVIRFDGHSDRIPRFIKEQRVQKTRTKYLGCVKPRLYRDQ